MRIILDTNILLSGILSSRGAPAKLLSLWERNQFTLVACDQLLAEFRDVVSRPFFRARIRGGTAELLAAGIRDFSLFFRHVPSVAVAPDAKDSYLLSLAELSQAHLLVTGDKELLSLKHHKSTRILTGADCLYELSPRRK